LNGPPLRRGICGRAGVGNLGIILALFGKRHHSMSVKCPFDFTATSVWRSPKDKMGSFAD
jgi:hypothetical protein